MGLVDKIKNDAKKSGQNRGKFIFFKEGTKTRIRFVVDMEDGMDITFHDSFTQGINVPCQETFGRDCPYCDDRDDLRTRSQYLWPVWDYEAKEVKLFMFPVNNCSPIPALMALYETYGTITDRDYVISVTGKQKDKSYAVVPMDKSKFRNEKAKPLSKSAILKLLDKAYPFEDIDNDEDDDEDEHPAKKSSTKKNKVKPSKKSKVEDEEEDEDDFDEDEPEEVDYEDMSAKELYKLCKEREIECKPKKPENYYINLLKEWDETQEEWGDSDEDEDDDDWAEEDDE